MGKLTLTYRDDFTGQTTTVEKTVDDFGGFKEIFEALRSMCMAIGYEPETVDSFFRLDKQ